VNDEVANLELWRVIARALRSPFSVQPQPQPQRHYEL
jgi:hypothetical protein